MRRALFIVLILAALGAAGWYFLLRPPPGAPPTLAAQVSAEHTLMFGSLERPDALARAFFARVQADPTLAAQLSEVTAANAAAVAGFDPTTAAGWQSVGVDPATGVAVVLDARAADTPYALLKITDEARFVAWLSARAGETMTLAEGQLRVNGTPRATVARRGAYTLLAAAAPLPALQVIAQDPGPRLVDAPGFDAAFAETTPGGRLTGFLPLANLDRATQLSGATAAQNIAFYAALFPALGAQVNAETVRIRVATSERGLGALKQLYTPRRAAPKFSKWLPKEGFALARMSVNLFELFDGIQALLPPSLPAELGAQVGFAKMGLAAVGLDWSLLCQAFTGHVAVAVRPAPGREPDVLALVALGTPASADKIIASVQSRIPKLLGGVTGGPQASIEDITVGGLPGKGIKLGPADLTMVRTDTVLIFATSKALAEEAIARAQGGGGLTGATAAKFDGDVVLAVHARPADMVRSEPSDPDHAALIAAPAIEGTVTLDRHGSLVEVDSRGLVGLAALAGRRVAAQRARAREQLKQIEDARRGVIERGGQP